MNPPIIVQKYGGSSVATTDKLRQVAGLVVAKKRQGYRLVVVVSAMGDATDELLARAKEISQEPDRRELDMLLSVGERISMALLALAIREHGEDAVSLTGSQSGIITNHSHSSAKIVEVRPFRIEDELDAGKIVIVAGYQGVSYRREITTLGRGGSDTTAVALAAALDAEACEIYSDVDGIYSADPRVVPQARQLTTLGYQEMQELAEAGAKVLNAQAVEFAKTAQIAIYAKKTGSPNPGTVVRKNPPQAKSGVRGIAHELSMVSIAATGVDFTVARAFLARLEALAVRPRQVQFIELSGGGAFSCVVGLDDVHAENALAQATRQYLGQDSLRNDLGAVSLIGEGITRDDAVMTTALTTLDTLGATPAGVSTSSFRITFLLPRTQVKNAVSSLHQALALSTAEAQVE